MKLTNHEKQEVLRHLNSGISLPDKYRFLLFDETRQVELLWNGKTDAVCDVVLPFQTIEQVDEPRSEKAMKQQLEMFDPQTGRQLKGWSNKLIWGDNKLILSSLLRGDLKREIEEQGGLKLIYIDPPFDVGADFTTNIEIGDETLTKEPGVLEQIAYRDTWGKGADSFIAMIYERLILMRDLLADDGSIYVHCDWRVNSYLRLVMDEVFGSDMFVNQVVWNYVSGGVSDRTFARKHDVIYLFSKGENYAFNVQKERKSISQNAKIETDDKGDFVWYIKPRTNPQVPKGVKSYLDKYVQDVWQIPIVNPQARERLNYPTQKPEALLERIIKASSNEGDLVADFFCGSGTTAAVAEKLNRKWVVSDLGKFAIHTTRKRMIGVQRELKADSENYRAFQILNLGKYERQHYIGVNSNLSDEQQQRQIARKSRDYQALILRAYSAQAVKQSGVFHGKKAGRMVAIGPINLPVTRAFAEEVVAECLRKAITRADILAFEFEMGLFPKIQEETKSKGVNLALKYIPAEVFDKRAVDKGEVVFHDVSYIEAKAMVKKGKVAVKLTDFSVYYSQDAGREALANLKVGKSRVIADAGQIVKITRRDGGDHREVLTKHWTDWIDYWAVDFDFESKPEVIRVCDDGKVSAVESGNFVFENEWQSFRTRRNRELELTSAFHNCTPGPRKIAVKVVDIFGNDTMRILGVTI